MVHADVRCSNKDSVCSRDVCGATGTMRQEDPFPSDGLLQMQWSNVVRHLVIELSLQQEWHADQVTWLGIDCLEVWFYL